MTSLFTKPIICLVNKTSLPDADANLTLIATALDLQILHHAAPAWRARAWHVIAANAAPAGTYPLYLFESPDVANALGYHDEDVHGNIYGRVFTDPIFAHNGTWFDGELSVSAVMSHEALEIFGDADCNLWVADGMGRLIAKELCDPVEADSYIIKTPTGAPGSPKTPVSVSNFVFPEWFDWSAPIGSRFDYMQTVGSAFAMSAGGYLIYEKDPNNALQEFNNETAQPHWKADLKAVAGARTLRRKRSLHAAGS